MLLSKCSPTILAHMRFWFGNYRIMAMKVILSSSLKDNAIVYYTKLGNVSDNKQLVGIVKLPSYDDFHGCGHCVHESGQHAVAESEVVLQGAVVFEIEMGFVVGWLEADHDQVDQVDLDPDYFLAPLGPS